MRAQVLVFIVCAIACVVAHSAIVVSTLRARTSGDPAIPRPRMFVELIWALLPVLALAFLLTATWSRISARERDRLEPVMKVAG